MLHQYSFKKYLFFLLLFYLLTLRVLFSQGSEIIVSSQIGYNDELHDYDLAGDEMGFHLLINNNGAINHYLLGNEGKAIEGYTKTFASTGAVKASISSLNGTVFVVYRLGSELKIWKSTNGGSSDSWTQGTPRSLTITSATSRISSAMYENFIHVAWDNGEEVYYNRYNVNDGIWLDNNDNVTDFEEGEEGKGVEPDITVSEHEGQVRVHVTYKNPENGPNSSQPGDTDEFDFFYAAYNRDLLLPGGWKDEAEIVERRSKDRMLYVYYSSPFNYIYNDDTAKIISVFTYADMKETSPPGEEHHYYLNRYKNADVDDEVWSNLVAIPGDDENSCHEYGCFIESHFIFSDIANSPDSLFWALKYPEDNKIHFRKYENNTFSDVKTLEEGDFPKMSANRSSSRFVTWKGTDDNIWVYRQSRPVSGTITENTMWSGKIWVDGNVTVNSGVTLHVASGTQIYFASGKKLIVNGRLLAHGNNPNRITFTRSGTTGTWAGIQIKAGANPSELHYCDLQYATMGIDIRYTGAENRADIYKCTIRNSSQHGIYIYNNSYSATVHPTIRYCYLDNNGNSSSYAGIYTYKSAPSISFCRIENSPWGIYSASGGSPFMTNCKLSYNDNGGIMAVYAGTTPYIKQNTISYNNDLGYATYGNGVWAYSSAEARDYDPGRNLLDHNEGNGLRASGATIRFGTVSPWEPGYHQVTQNSLDSYPNYQAVTESGGHIDACLSYWNPQLWSGSVNANPTLSSPPSNPPAGWGYPDDWDPTQGGGSMALTEPPGAEMTPVTQVELQAAIDRGLAGKDSSDWLAARYLLSEALRQLQIELPTELDQTYVEKQTQNSDVQAFVRKQLGLVRALSLVGDDQSAEAITWLEQLKKLLPENRIEFLANQGLIYAYALDELEKAKQIADDILRLGQDSTDYNQYCIVLDNYPGAWTGSLAKGKASTRDAIQPDESFCLQENYPNPFNPVTSIRYHIPVECEVILQVFNVRGEKVRTLVHGNQPAGSYELRWDGKNDLGQSVAAGIYICQLQAGEYQKSIRLVLVR